MLSSLDLDHHSRHINTDPYTRIYFHCADLTDAHTHTHKQNIKPGFGGGWQPSSYTAGAARWDLGSCFFVCFLAVIDTHQDLRKESNDGSIIQFRRGRGRMLSPAAGSQGGFGFEATTTVSKPLSLSLGSSSASAPSAAPAHVMPALSVQSRPATSTDLQYDATTWYKLLGLNPSKSSDAPILKVAHQAEKYGLPSLFKYENGVFVNKKTKREQKTHPLLKYWKNKAHSKITAIRYGVESDDDNSASEINTSDMCSDEDEEAYAAVSRGVTPMLGGPPLTSNIQSTQNEATFSTSSQPQEVQGRMKTPSLEMNTSVNDSRVGLHSNPFAVAPSPEVPSLKSYENQSVLSTQNTYQDIMTVQQAQESRLNELAYSQSIRESHLPPVDIVAAASYGERDLSNVHHQQLIAQIKSQEVTIADLRRAKQMLQNERDSANLNMQQLLDEQRKRLESQRDDDVRRLEAELENKTLAMKSLEAKREEEIARYELKLRAYEKDKASLVVDTNREAEGRFSAQLEHLKAMHEVTINQLKQQNATQLQAMQELHAKELRTLASQQHDGAMLSAIAGRVEYSAQHLENLQQKVKNERSNSERITLEQIAIREDLLRDKEDSLEKQRRQNQAMMKTLEKMTKEHEEERARLKREQDRLESFQQDLQAETSLLREQLESERSRLGKERVSLQIKQTSWDNKLKQEMSELEAMRDFQERATREATSSLHEAQQERANIMRQLDAAKDELRTIKVTLLTRTKRLEEDENALRSDQEEFQKHVKFFETRMNELTALGARVKEQSTEVSDMYKEATRIREKGEQARAEGEKLQAMYLRKAEKLKEDHDQATIALEQDRQSLTNQFEEQTRQLMEQTEAEIRRIHQDLSTQAQQLKDERMSYEQHRLNILKEQRSLIKDKEAAQRRLSENEKKLAAAETQNKSLQETINMLKQEAKSRRKEPVVLSSVQLPPFTFPPESPKNKTDAVPAQDAAALTTAAAAVSLPAATAQAVPASAVSVAPAPAASAPLSLSSTGLGGSFAWVGRPALLVSFHHRHPFRSCCPDFFGFKNISSARDLYLCRLPKNRRPCIAKTSENSPESTRRSKNLQKAVTR